jgi:nucleoid DNA-binding protein
VTKFEQLCKKAAAKSGAYHGYEVCDTVKAFLQVVREEILAGESVKLEGLVTLTPVRKEGYTTTFNLNGERIQIPERTVLKVKKDPKLRVDLNPEEK